MRTLPVTGTRSGRPSLQPTRVAAHKAPNSIRKWIVERCIGFGRQQFDVHAE